MLSKIFKKDEPSTPPPPAPQKGAQKAVAPEVALEWRSKFQRAVGDDAALLALATESPLLDIKQAAVQAMQGEEALKAAEREFRTHDRRVHRLAKQRYEHALAQRESRVTADALIQNVDALLHDENVPANHLVDLDHAWTALDASLLTHEQTAIFQSRWEQLIAQTRGRGDQLLIVSRWSNEAKRKLQEASKLVAEVKSGTQEQSALAGAAQSLQAVLVAKPAMEPDADSADGVAAPLSALETELQAALAKLADLDVALSKEAAQREEGTRQADQREHAKAESRAAQHAHHSKVSEALVLAEAALAAGHLAETNTHLVAVDAIAHKEKSMPAALAKRIEAVQTEYARLKGWQHWGGGRARDDLVTEAEALAQRVANPEAKIAIKQHADEIDSLRVRWKELDKLGGATSRALWLRFDTSLKAAYVPVAAHLAKLKAARQENLAARQQLIATLDLVVLDSAGEKSPDWREIARAIEHFNTEWRKLGPLEHTVPHKSREALVKKMQDRLARLDAPLGEARRVAQLQRESMIARAHALAADAQHRDTITKVRDLQNEWQSHAKSLPLARNAENALWNTFKTATDAVFKQRDAANAAREGAWNEQRTAREALITRLRELPEDAGANEVKKTLHEVDALWRKAGEVARKDAPQLDTRYRNAREAAQKMLASSAGRAWSRVVGALETKCALCDEVAAGNAENIDARWNEAGSLPPAWEQALQARRANKGAMPAAKYDTVLLRAEGALDVESPAAFQASRRALKLLAMKAAIEGRQASATTEADIRTMIAELVAQAPHDATARTRFVAIIEGLKKRPLA